MEKSHKRLELANEKKIYRKINVYASESGTALAKGLGQMSLVNDYQTFRPNLGSSSVVVRLQGKVTYISVGGGAGEMAVGGKIMGGKIMGGKLVKQTVQ